MLGPPPDERTVLLFAAVKISSTRRLYLQFYMSAFYIVLNSPVPCGYMLFTVLFATLVYTYVLLQYIQTLCQSRLGTADHAITYVFYVTTAA